VAAPTVAPTSCLKVRHMFDRQAMASRNPGMSRAANTNAWVWQVKEEILQRCSTGNSAQILHIAVDTESSEGCVYIKAKNTEEAAKVFNALHGQWYAGNLVTVKYMREERYHDRFPDSRHQHITLKPASSKLKPL
jgi:membrane protein Man1